MISWYEKLRLNFKYKVWPKIARNWFYIFLPCVMIVSFNIVNETLGKIETPKCEIEADRPNCYIFYGLAQNDLSIEKERDFLKINYLVEGFPAVEHDVFIEIVDHRGKVDFLYSERHTPSHKAHYAPNRGQKIYKAYYKIPHRKLGPGKWKLRVTFRFQLPLGTTRYISNDIKFEIK